MPPKQKSLIQDIISYLSEKTDDVSAVSNEAYNGVKSYFGGVQPVGANPVAQPREISPPSISQYPEYNNPVQEQTPYKRSLIDEIVTGGDPKKRAYNRQEEMMRRQGLIQ